MVAHSQVALRGVFLDGINFLLKNFNLFFFFLETLNLTIFYIERRRGASEFSMRPIKSFQPHTLHRTPQFLLRGQNALGISGERVGQPILRVPRLLRFSQVKEIGVGFERR